MKPKPPPNPWKKGVIVLSAFILSLYVFAAIFLDKKPPPEPTAKVVNAPAYPTATPKIIYREPKVGMDYLEFQNLCGKPVYAIDDDMDTYESAYGMTITLRFEYKEHRSKNNCWGTFTFRNEKLDSIYRR